jgi:hypothetical protein
MGRKGKGSRKLELAQADVHLQGGAHSGARASVSPLGGVHLIRWCPVLEPLRMTYTGSCVARNRRSKCHQKLPLEL